MDPLPEGDSLQDADNLGVGGGVVRVEIAPDGSRHKVGCLGDGAEARTETRRVQGGEVGPVDGDDALLGV